MNAGNLAVGGALLQVAGSLVAFRQSQGRRRLLGDTLVYAGILIVFGSFIAWLFA